MKTSESQIEAIKAYKKGKKPFSIWYDSTEIDKIDLAIKKKGLKPREIFELGLGIADIEQPKS